MAHENKSLTETFTKQLEMALAAGPEHKTLPAHGTFKTGSHGLAMGWIFTDDTHFSDTGMSSNMDGVNASTIVTTYDNCSGEVFTNSVMESLCTENLQTWEGVLEGQLLSGYTTADVSHSPLTYHCISGTIHRAETNYPVWSASTTIADGNGNYVSAIVWCVDYASEYSSTAIQTMLTDMIACISRMS